MIDKILSVKASSGTMTFFMAMHILIMSGGAEDGENYYFEMIMFLTLTLLAGSTFYMDAASARKALLAFGVGSRISFQYLIHHLACSGSFTLVAPLDPAPFMALHHSNSGNNIYQLSLTRF